MKMLTWRKSKILRYLRDFGDVRLDVWHGGPLGQVELTPSHERWADWKKCCRIQIS